MNKWQRRICKQKSYQILSGSYFFEPFRSEKLKKNSAACLGAQTRAKRQPGQAALFFELFLPEG